jgi:hypothetical protein
VAFTAAVSTTTLETRRTQNSPITSLRVQPESGGAGAMLRSTSTMRVTSGQTSTWTVASISVLPP